MNKIPVVILAGGLGTRLGEETIKIPKPMVMVGEKPLLWHIMKTYTHYGFRSFIICLGYKSEVIKEYFYHYSLINNDVTFNIGKKNRITYHHQDNIGDITVTLAETGYKSMTGSRVKQIEKYISSDIFMLTYGDGVADININNLFNFHKKHGKIATITGVNPPARFGDIIMKNEQVVKFAEKPDSSDSSINGGYFVFDKRVFSYLSADQDCTLERDPLEKLASDQQLMVYQHKGFWRCVDTPRELTQLNESWKNGTSQWKVW